MSKHESRKERKKRENHPESGTRSESQGGMSRIYYYIIGFLFLILIVLVVYIFNRSGDNVNLNTENADETAVVEDNEDSTNEPVEERDESDQEVTGDNAVDNEGASDENENSNGEDSEEEDSTDGLESDDSTVVNEDAPHDSSYATNFNDGSSDRIAIKNEVMAATGLDSDLIEWWVGNNGPGRVEATVSNRDQTEVYQVFLQYGEGSWHVTDFEELPSVPNN